MSLRLIAVSALVAGLGLGGAVIPGLCTESDAPAQPVPRAVAMTTEQSQIAPEFAGISNWFNSQPLKLADLRGKVVLVDFWTYGCVNCVNTLPHVTELYSKYRDRGLVVIGVHTPEFPFEHSASNVQAALKRHGILYPVAQDNNSQTWNAYGNQHDEIRLHGVVPHRLPGLLDRACELSGRAGRVVVVDEGRGLFHPVQLTGRRSSRSPSAWASSPASSCPTSSAPTGRLFRQGRAGDRAADGLRGADRLLPRGRLPRRHAVRPEPRRPEAALRRHPHGRRRHADLGHLDPLGQFLDADAGRLCDQR
jgi:thiol-disulfide isomerase/thioredoxin